MYPASTPPTIFIEELPPTPKFTYLHVHLFTMRTCDRETSGASIIWSSCQDGGGGICGGPGPAAMLISSKVEPQRVVGVLTACGSERHASWYAVSTSCM